MEILVRESKVLIEWFSQNQMKANPEKIQALAVGEKTFSKKTSFQNWGGGDRVWRDSEATMSRNRLAVKI